MCSLKPLSNQDLVPKSGFNLIQTKLWNCCHNKEKKNVLVICPGFSSDCVETLEEINIQGRESFIKNGGVQFDLIPCLNDEDDHINLFENLLKNSLI